jgi:hypothetical protein
MGRLCYPTQPPGHLLIYFSQKAVTVQGGYGTCFCHPGTNFIEHYACRGTSLISGTDLSRCNKCYKWVLAQCRGTSLIGARNLSRCRIYFTGRCGRPGGSFGRVCLGSRSRSKNRDNTTYPYCPCYK